MEASDPRSPPPFPLPGTLTSRRSSVLLDEVDGQVVVRIKNEVEFVLSDLENVEDVFDWAASLRLAPASPGPSFSGDGLPTHSPGPGSGRNGTLSVHIDSPGTDTPPARRGDPLGRA